MCSGVQQRVGMGSSSSTVVCFSEMRCVLKATIRNAEECVQALAAALEAIDPSLDVYEGILQLIAEFVPYGKDSRALWTIGADN